jgi:hypothetical protein
MATYYNIAVLITAVKSLTAQAPGEQTFKAESLTLTGCLGTTEFKLSLPKF